MGERFVKTYYGKRSAIDGDINGEAKAEGLTIISVSIAHDGAGGIYASVVFEKKPKPEKKRKVASNDKD